MSSGEDHLHSKLSWLAEKHTMELQTGRKDDAELSFDVCGPWTIDCSSQNALHFRQDVLDELVISLLQLLVGIMYGSRVDW